MRDSAIFIGGVVKATCGSMASRGGLSTEDLYRCYEVLEGAKGDAASEVGAGCGTRELHRGHVRQVALAYVCEREQASSDVCAAQALACVRLTGGLYSTFTPEPVKEWLWRRSG